MAPTRGPRWRVRSTSFPALTTLVAAVKWNLAGAAVERGTVLLGGNGGDGVAFLAKFCVGNSGPHPLNEDERTVGEFFVSVRKPDHIADMSQLRLALFDDQAKSYPYATRSSRWEHLGCEVQLQHSRYNQPVHPSGWTPLNVTGKIRPRFWYIALADCEKRVNPLVVHYEVHMKTRPDDWESEVSMDKHGLLRVFLPLFFVYGALLVSQIRANRLTLANHMLACAREVVASKATEGCADGASAARQLHPLQRMLTAGLLFATSAMALGTLHYFLMALKPEWGSIPQGVYLAKKFAQISAKFLLMSVLLLVSKGRCVSYALTLKDVHWVCRVIVPFVAASFILELWGEYSVSQVYSPGFVYTTPAGLVVVLLDLSLLGVYATHLYRVYMVTEGCNEMQATFYRTWGVLYALWFLILPAMTLLAYSYLIPPWVSSWAESLVANAGHAVAYAALVVGLWPTRQAYFNLNSKALPVAPEEIGMTVIGASSYSEDKLMSGLIEKAGGEFEY
eukprot:TRINITY_DN52404_c1_g1_i1.p1 TRINITY_DN52404_c1_g1~~TRINITY_DN52404_c1_g1_i1.p1  ORF type:complete len:526 (-),score=83.75 TRINITY_DN52404_c1_g1_i1:190-1707(-)